MNIIYLLLIINLCILICITIFYVLFFKNHIIRKLSNIHNKLLSYDNNNSTCSKIKIPIYYINLKRSPDRNIYMKSQLKKYNLFGKRIDAIDGNEINMHDGNFKLNDNMFIDYTNKYNNCSIYELACTLSHLKAIHTAYIDNNDYALILEDDASFALLPFWNFTLSDIMKNAPSDWTIISLFGFECTDPKDIYVSFTDKKCYSCVAYIINKKGMLNVLRDIINSQLIILDPKLMDLNSKYIVADVLLYYRSKGTYNYVENPTIYPYNNTKMMDSTIHTDHTKYQVTKTLNALNKYIDIL